MIVLGVDGGLGGGLVFLEDGKIIFKCTMPVKAGKKTKNIYDEQAIKGLLVKYRPNVVFLEYAQGMRGQGLTSTFNIGKNFGFMQGLCLGLSIPVVIVHPIRWMNKMYEGLDRKAGETKDLGFKKCQEIYPDESWVKSTKSKKFHNGMTDAAMIATYGFLTLKENKNVL